MGEVGRGGGGREVERNRGEEGRGRKRGGRRIGRVRWRRKGERGKRMGS